MLALFLHPKFKLLVSVSNQEKEKINDNSKKLIKPQAANASHQSDLSTVSFEADHTYSTSKRK